MGGRGEKSSEVVNEGHSNKGPNVGDVGGVRERRRSHSLKANFIQ